MPPTISVTVGRLDTLLTPLAEEPPEPLELPELLQAARAATRAAALAAPAILVRERLDIWAAPVCVVVRGSRDAGLGLRGRPPGKQAPFQQADQALGGQREDRDDEHRAEHAVGVEVV